MVREHEEKTQKKDTRKRHSKALPRRTEKKETRRGEELQIKAAISVSRPLQKNRFISEVENQQVIRGFSSRGVPLAARKFMLINHVMKPASAQKSTHTSIMFKLPSN